MAVVMRLFFPPLSSSSGKGEKEPLWFLSFLCILGNELAWESAGSSNQCQTNTSLSPVPTLTESQPPMSLIRVYTSAVCIRNKWANSNCWRAAWDTQDPVQGPFIGHVKINRQSMNIRRANPSLTPDRAHRGCGQRPRHTRLFAESASSVQAAGVSPRLKMRAVGITLVLLGSGQSLLSVITHTATRRHFNNRVRNSSTGAFTPGRV